MCQLMQSSIAEIHATFSFLEDYRENGNIDSKYNCRKKMAMKKMFELQATPPLHTPSCKNVSLIILLVILNVLILVLQPGSSNKSVASRRSFSWSWDPQAAPSGMYIHFKIAWSEYFQAELNSVFLLLARLSKGPICAAI